MDNAHQPQRKRERGLDDADDQRGGEREQEEVPGKLAPVGERLTETDVRQAQHRGQHGSQDQVQEEGRQHRGVRRRQLQLFQECVALHGSGFGFGFG
jgi:hypothetical protein